MLRLYSIFRSIQGESTWAGLPCVFVRLAGCPLNCVYCDTRGAAESEGKEVSIEEVLLELDRLSTPLVEVTGGEPMVQVDTLPLLERLVDRGITVLLETSGAFDLNAVNVRVRKIVDVKCPDSGENSSFLPENISYLQRGRDEVKFVISSEADFVFAVDFCRRHSLFDKAELLISPVGGLVSLEEAAKWILETSLPLRLQPQLHKLIWPFEKGER